jgi:uncharacterized protein YyaL (SSP411 family)
VIAYSDPTAQHRFVRGMLDDYAYMVSACLDAYETTADLTYFRSAKQIADSMIARFYDQTSGGFFDTETARSEAVVLGALAARRKPFQDAPTPAGNPAAALALLRLHALTNDSNYHDKAEDTLEVFAGVAEQFGIYAGTYGLASIWMARPHLQVVVVGSGEIAHELYRAATQPFAFNKTVLRITDNEAAAAYLPPALAQTVPNLPGVAEGNTMAVVCSNFTCLPPITDPEELERTVREAITKS